MLQIDNNLQEARMLRELTASRLKLLNQGSSYTFKQVLTESESPNEYVYI